MQLKSIFRTIVLMALSLSAIRLCAQEGSYKKRVLESTEVDFLMSYYEQQGNNAAVSGGIGNEELTDITPTFVIQVPLNDDDVLTIDAGISAYTSASSSNVDPFGGAEADAFIASSGASGADTWANATVNYSHSSDDRNTIWGGKVSVSAEYDYTSIGFGGSLAKLFNEKNTEVSIAANVYIDTWSAIYPVELRNFGSAGVNSEFFRQYNITGEANYNPSNFSRFANKGRNSYALNMGFSQILSRRMQGALMLDIVRQQGLLSTPFQRVYFRDVGDSFIQNFHLADDIERLPDNRTKVAAGGRLNYYINEVFVLRTYYRYYQDDWGISSQTASIEVPVKVSNRFTLYPSYRYYQQTAADYFAGYNEHLSTADFYTSDFDLSEYTANQFAFGISYTDVFTDFKLGKYGLKSIDLKYLRYERNTGLTANLISFGIKFVAE